MKILMFGWEFPPHISGGLGTACYGLTKGLSAFEDVKINFVIPKTFGGEERNSISIIDASKIPLSREAIKRLKSLHLIKGQSTQTKISAYISPEKYQEQFGNYTDETLGDILLSSAGTLEFSGGYGSDIYNEIKKYGIVAGEIASSVPHDLIHAHDWLTFNAGIEARKRSGKPLIVHVHATEFDRTGENYNPHVFRLEQMGMMEADVVIAVSNLTRNTIINKYHIPPGKVVTIYNGVEPAEEIKAELFSEGGLHAKIVTYLGRITFQKGPEYFVETASLVLKRMDNVHFVMAGSGDLMTRMIHLVAKMGIADKFHFTGFLKGTDVSRMLKASDLFIMPSVSEPFGIAPLEALQNHVPVIISKQSGVSEVLKNAVKVDFWDTHAMADAIFGILNYEKLADHLIKNGRSEVGKLNWTEAASKVRNLYQSLLNRYA